MFSELKQILKDCGQSAAGEYDPARVVGYGVSLIGSVVFLGLTVYVTLVNKTFDSSGFAVGLGGISATVAAAAGGVWMKKSTETPVVPPTPACDPAPSQST